MARPEAAVFTSRTGTVVDFDVDTGIGHVRDGDGDRWFFHCTAIADGSRRIDVGTEVEFEVVPGRRGVYEATRVRPV